MQGYTKNQPLDTDPLLSANSDYIAPSQSAVKAALAAYLKLDASNGPITGPLVFDPSTDTLNIKIVKETGDTQKAFSVYMGANPNPVAYIDQNGNCQFANLSGTNTGDASITSISGTISSFSSGQSFDLSVVPSAIAHNDFGSKQGGTAGEYYHLTSAQVAALHAAVTVSDTSTVDLTLSGQALSAAVLPAGIAHNDLGSKQGGTTGEYYHLTSAQSTNVGNMREVLTAARTYYVRTDGSDSNTGLANTAGGAFLTIQKAINVATALDLSLYNVTINVADGTYAQALTLRTIVGAGSINITGNTTTPANVILNTGTAFTANSVKGTYNLRGFKVSGAGYGILAQNASIVNFGNFVFANTTVPHVYASGKSIVTALQNYEISSSTTIHLQASRGGYINVSGRTITITGTPAYTWFVYADMMGLLEIFGMTFTGTATGARYFSGDNSVVFTNGGGATYLPGNSAGTTLNGGQYI